MSWFKNIQAYRLIGFAATAEEMNDALSLRAFRECGSLDNESCGWVSPRDNGLLVHAVNRQMLITLGAEKKLLPASVINQVTKARCAELEEQQGFKPGRKQTKEIKEAVIDELLPRAFAVRRATHVWIDPVHGWLMIDTASPSRADEVIKWLYRSIEHLPLSTLRLVRQPAAAMTDWLAADEAPLGFTIDQDTELRATGLGKSSVKYVHHSLEAEDVRRHIAAGKQCTRLALTWNDQISFVLTENLTIRRIAPLDVMQESNEVMMRDSDERFDTDFALMTGELAKMMADLVSALGGEGPPEKGQTDIDDIEALKQAETA